MSDPQPTDKPYHEVHACFGRYMEPGTEWEDIPDLCPSKCPVRHQCWAIKNKKPEKKE